MSKEPRFWRNVALIGLAHVALVAGLLRWNQTARNAPGQSVVWINSAAGGGPAPAKSYGANPTPAKASIPLPEETPPPQSREAEEDHPVLTSVKSDIQLPSVTPNPTPPAKPTVTPLVKATPKPPAKPHKPTPKPSPKPTVKPTPKPTPKPSPKKTVLAKASPKPSPKVMPSPANEDDEEADADAEKKKIAKAALAKADASETEGESTEKPVRKAIAAHGNGDGSSAEGGSRGAGEGGGGASEFGWYGAMLHDRFYSEWTQPTTTVSSNSKISALVKIRIEQDGRVSNFEIIKPSGNVMIDESVAAIAKRVRQVDPLPAGLGHGGHYDVKINFELNSEQ